MKLTIELDRYSISYYMIETIKAIMWTVLLLFIVFLFGSPIMEHKYDDTYPQQGNFLEQMWYGVILLSTIGGLIILTQIVKSIGKTLTQNALVHEKRNKK